MYRGELGRRRRWVQLAGSSWRLAGALVVALEKVEAGF